ncbi:hypothetical protein PMAYCL1PPCAC_16599, partial [Pristionchus mayeri]
ILMDMHAFWTFLLCLSTFVNCSITMHAHLTMDAPTDIIVEASTCSMRRAPAIWSTLGSIFSQLAMAVERSRASDNLERYEKTNGTVGRSLNAIHIVVVVLFWVAHLHFYGSDWRTIHCTLANPDATIFITSLGAIFSLTEIATIVYFKRLILRNKQIRKNSQDVLGLSERFQLAENIRMINVLSPIIWSHTSLGIVGGVFYFILKYVFPAPEMYPLIEESASILYFQGICMPMIFLHRHR